jgi:hypothetical protein
VVDLTRIYPVAARQDGVVTAAQCRTLGLHPADVATLCRSGRWLRLARGVYLVDAHVVGTPGRRTMIRAAVLSFGADAVAVLGSAAELYGIGGLSHRDGVDVSLPGPRARPRRILDQFVRPHQLVLQPADVTTVEGIPVTTALRTVADLMLRLDRYSAISVLDSSLNRGFLDDADLGLLAASMAGRRGVVESRRWLDEADGRAESPLESRSRLRCVDGRVPPDELQYPVHDRSGRLLGYGDLAWTRARLVAEADGVEPHSQPEAIFRDRRRQNDFANAGFTVIRFTWQDTVAPDYVPYVVRAALARAAAA